MRLNDQFQYFITNFTKQDSYYLPPRKSIHRSYFILKFNCYHIILLGFNLLLIGLVFFGIYLDGVSDTALDVE